MAHTFAPVQALSPPFSTRMGESRPFLRFHRVCVCHQNSGQEVEPRNVPRRTVTLGLALAGTVLTIDFSNKDANAAGRRAPPPPPGEKKDLSMTALQAKVMASKKRREALKEEVARLRESGKAITSKSE